MLIPRQQCENLPTKEYLNRDILIAISSPLPSFLVRKNFLTFLALLKEISLMNLTVLENNYSLQGQEY